MQYTDYSGKRTLALNCVLSFLDLIQESREAKEIENKVTVTKSQTQRTDCTKMLWRAFQFAFRVYSFAGGHDDHAENLSKELAHEIETSS